MKKPCCTLEWYLEVRVSIEQRSEAEKSRGGEKSKGQI